MFECIENFEMQYVVKIDQLKSHKNEFAETMLPISHLFEKNIFDLESK